MTKTSAPYGSQMDWKTIRSVVLLTPPVRPQKGVQWRKTAWHLWATVGGWVPTESRSGATRCSLVCRTTIAHCNRQFLGFKFCSSQCRCVLHCHSPPCHRTVAILNHILNLDFSLLRFSSSAPTWPAWEYTLGNILFKYHPSRSCYWVHFTMNFTFIAAAVALIGLFGLAFALYCVLHSRRNGGKPNKRHPT